MSPQARRCESWCTAAPPPALASPQPYPFFAKTSLSARLSSAWSATIDFSRRFSAFSCRSRRSSEISSPPYLLRQVYNVASEIPCRRHTSLTCAPASASFSTPIICSSLNRPRFLPALYMYIAACVSAGKENWVRQLECLRAVRGRKEAGGDAPQEAEQNPDGRRSRRAAASSDYNARPGHSSGSWEDEGAGRSECGDRGGKAQVGGSTGEQWGAVLGTPPAPRHYAAGQAARRAGLRAGAVEGGSDQNVLVGALRAAELPVVIIHPRRVREFAKSRGQLAKTDHLDARVLAL